MLKKALSTCALLLSSVTLSHAGTMGDMVTQPTLIPFMAGEALYAWPDVGRFVINVTNRGTYTDVADKDGWGGRFALGAIHPFNETWGGSAEIGWGYYGQIDMIAAARLLPGVSASPNTDTDAFYAHLNQYGFDVVAGLIYMQPKYDLFIKAGALIQNLRGTLKVNPVALSGAAETAETATSGIAYRFPGSYKLGLTMVNALPELRLGGGYHLRDNWLLTASWMHAFGSEFKMNSTLTPSPAILGTTAAQIRVPTIDVVLFGLEYRFC